MHHSILSVVLFLGIFLSACASPAAPSPTLPPRPADTATPLPTATLVPPTATETFTPTPTEIPVFWDDFNKTLLPGWTWIRENQSLWSLDSEPGWLRIVLTSDRPPRNLLVREVTHENFQIMTHVRFKPTTNFQFAGLLVYKDDNNDVALGRAFCDSHTVCVGNGIYFDALQDGKGVGGNFATDTTLKDEAYLRLDKVGSKFTAYYSENGTDWMMIGEHEINLVDPRVGLITANSHVVGLPALFDYFTVMEMP